MPGPLPDQHAKILAQKLVDGQLAMFVGAGLSRQAIVRDGSGRRLPLWKELAEQVAKTCHEDLADYGGNILDLFDAIVYAQSPVHAGTGGAGDSRRRGLRAFAGAWGTCRAAVGGRLHDEL